MKFYVEYDKLNKTMNIYKWFRSIPEENKLVAYGKLAFIKNLFYFLFKILVGIIFKSWFLITIALYSLCIGVVKNICSRGLNSKDDKRNINRYILGGAVLTASSIFYIVYSVFQMFIPTNFSYNIIIAIAIAAFATYSIVVSIIGVVKMRGKSALIKEYKLTNFATAFNNLVLTQIAILSFTTNADNSFYNGLMGVIVGFIILVTSIYLLIDGVKKKKKYYQEINNKKNET